MEYFNVSIWKREYYWKTKEFSIVFYEMNFIQRFYNEDTYKVTREIFHLEAIKVEDKVLYIQPKGSKHNGILMPSQFYKITKIHDFKSVLEKALIDENFIITHRIQLELFYLIKDAYDEFEFDFVLGDKVAKKQTQLAFLTKKITSEWIENVIKEFDDITDKDELDSLLLQCKYKENKYQFDTFYLNNNVEALYKPDEEVLLLRKQKGKKYITRKYDNIIFEDFNKYFNKNSEK